MVSLSTLTKHRAAARLFGAPVQHFARGPWPCKCNLEICLDDFSNEALYYLAHFVEACMHDQTRVPHSGLLGGEKFSEIAFSNSAIWCTFLKQFVLFIFVLFIFRCKSNFEATSSLLACESSINLTLLACAKLYFVFLYCIGYISEFSLHNRNLR